MSTIPVHVLRSVRVAEPGNIYGREIVAETGDVVPAELFDGLEAAGYIAAAGAPENKAPAADPISIPADWRDLHHMKMIALAKQFDVSVNSKGEAIAVLDVFEKAMAAPANKALGGAPENKAQG